MSTTTQGARNAGHPAECGCPDCRRSPRPNHYGLSKVFSRDLESSADLEFSAKVNDSWQPTIKTNEQKILWWVRVIGVITLIGFFVGAFVGGKAAYDAVQMERCLDEHSLAYCMSE
jgi:hypothetical protein